MKKFYVKAHMNRFCSTTHFARYVEAENIHAARVIFEETYGWNNRIDIIKEVTE